MGTGSGESGEWREGREGDGVRCGGDGVKRMIAWQKDDDACLLVVVGDLQTEEEKGKGLLQNERCMGPKKTQMYLRLGLEALPGES